MPLPGNGTLSLQGHSRPGDTVHSKPKQAMIVRMSAETLEALETFPQQPPMDFDFGENPVRTYLLWDCESYTYSLKRVSSLATFSFPCAHSKSVPRTIYICVHLLLLNPWPH